MRTLQSPMASALREPRVFPLLLPPRGVGVWGGGPQPLSPPCRWVSESGRKRLLWEPSPLFCVVAAGAHAPICVLVVCLEAGTGGAAPETDEGLYLALERGPGKPGLSPPCSRASGYSHAGPLNWPSPTPSVSGLMGN